MQLHGIITKHIELLEKYHINVDMQNRRLDTYRWIAHYLSTGNVQAHVDRDVGDDVYMLGYRADFRRPYQMDDPSLDVSAWWVDDHFFNRTIRTTGFWSLRNQDKDCTRAPVTGIVLDEMTVTSAGLEPAPGTEADRDRRDTVARLKRMETAGYKKGAIDHMEAGIISLNEETITGKCLCITVYLTLTVTKHQCTCVP